MHCPFSFLFRVSLLRSLVGMKIQPHRFHLILSFTLLSHCNPFVIMSSSSPLSALEASTTSENSNDKSKSSARSVIDFLTISRGLKTQPRTGWVRQEANSRIESVADHSWRISLMAMVAGFASSSSDESIDTNRCIQMALVHDLAEASVGDITPYCGVSDQDKHQRELNAMSELASRLGGGGGQLLLCGEQILSLWKEYEEGTTLEAKLVKDMDKLEMILQALEYENDGENKKSLDGFFDSTRGKWRTKIGEEWGREIESRRNK